MADQFDNNARSPHPDAEIDDPLAELARIIGYERPSEDVAKTDDAPEPSEFDLEAELMRELDVPQAPSIDELDRIEADEALDVMLSDNVFDPEPEPEPQVAEAELDPGHDYQAEAPVDDVPEFDSADFLSVEGRSSDDLLRAIEGEFPVDLDVDPGSQEPVVDDEWALSSELEEADAAQPEPEDADAPQDFVAASGVFGQAVVAGPAATQAADDIGDDVLADMVRFDLGPESAEAPDHSDAPRLADEPQPEVAGDEATLDFEEYLSTELDVFKHEVEIGGNPDEAHEAAQAPVRDDDGEFDVETALDALNDATLDDEVAVFDDAAEELLAAINGDVEFSGDAEPALEVPVQEAGEWSLDSIEENAADELDDELGDMFGLPERAVDPVAVKADASDDFELDLEQVLADSFDGSGDDWAEPVEVESGPGGEQVADDWLSSAPAIDQPVERDELTDAFLGFAPEGVDQVSQAEPVAGNVGKGPAAVQRSAEPEQGDWLDGFETAEHIVEPGASQAASSDYYFDADLIADSDETVEVVTDIDVPELPVEEPQAFAPDYDTEIEREFADIIDRSEPGLDERPTDGVSATFGPAEGWSRDATASRGHEVSDDYIALERELDAGFDDPGFAAATPAGYVVDGMENTDDFPGELNAAHERADNGSRGPVLAVSVLGLALLAGVAAFGWSMLSGDETTADGGPRIIRADKDPVKVLPENPGGVTVPNQDKAVYDRVAGGTGASTGQPALVNSAEEPVDVVQRTLDPEILPLEGRSDFAGKSEERLSANGTSDDTAPGGTAAPVVSPRKVRTMIVKPDGSIVAREAATPEVPVSAETPQTLAAASPEASTTAQPAQAPEPFVRRSVETANPVQDQPESSENPATEGTVAPVRIVKTQPIRPVANAPVPQGRPADQPVNVVGTVGQDGRVGAAPAAPAASAAPATSQPVEVASAPAAAAPAANPGGYYVQIASQPTAEGAQASWRTLSNRYSSVLGGLSVDIQRADIPGKGVFHRVRVPAGTRDQANALCSRYKAAGGSCFVSR
ncbi:SPOR domain-containing protein [Hoeflea sp.]|uniref:SPOR domain-containing protein n=1 Tax=Hoeflea sp. TaxID=1940281 RepID=UPI003A8DFEF8